MIAVVALADRSRRPCRPDLTSLAHDFARHAKNQMGVECQPSSTSSTAHGGQYTNLQAEQAMASSETRSHNPQCASLLSKNQNSKTPHLGQGDGSDEARRSQKCTMTSLSKPHIFGNGGGEEETSGETRAPTWTGIAALSQIIGKSL